MPIGSATTLADVAMMTSMLQVPLASIITTPTREVTHADFAKFPKSHRSMPMSAETNHHATGGRRTGFANAYGKGQALWRHVLEWLKKAPVTDPIDRRNAPFMQLLLIYIGCKTLPYKIYLLLFNPSYKIFFPGHEWPGAPPFPMAFDLGTDLLLTVSAWAGLYMIRKGAFRQAVMLLLCAMALEALIAYAAFGYLIWRVDMIAFEVFALAGFMHSRKALWLLFGAFILASAAGMTTDYFRNPQVMHSLRVYNALPPLILAYFVLVVILDRTSTSLRRALAESDRQRHQLQQEMAERERAQEQLLHAQKVDAIGRLSSGIAHDFNNVIGIILGFSLERHRLDEPGAVRNAEALALANALDGVEMAARRGAAISRKLLNFSRSDITRAEVFDAIAALEELVPMLHQLFPSSIRLVLETGDSPLPICFDRSQFELAILNIASNARDAMPDGGEFIIAAAGGDSFASLTLRDSGSGMSDEVRQHIFEPFFTTKPASKGTGLGLAVIHRLIQNAGGRIEVESSTATGTSLRIELPLATAPVDDPVRRDDIRVLLVDDDDDLRHLLARALESSGCTVSTAASGAEAIHAVEHAKLPPQIMVCDNRMPDIDGTALLQQLRLRLPKVPAILISAYLETDWQPPAVDDPFNIWLPKPFAPDRLVDCVFKAATSTAERDARTNPQT